MKHFFIVASLAAVMISCNKTETTKEGAKTSENTSGFKTAYIDTEKLMKEYQESKDFEAKYKAMSDRMQNELDSDMKAFQRDVQDLQQNAQSKGMEWARNREAELSRRQLTLQQKEQNYMKKFQEEGAVERDSMVSKMKAFIKDYGKDKNFDYVFGTGDAATVLYAKDSYNITEDILKLMNEAYAKKGGKEAPKEEPKKEETSKEKK